MPSVIPFTPSLDINIHALILRRNSTLGGLVAQARSQPEARLYFTFREGDKFNTALHLAEGNYFELTLEADEIHPFDGKLTVMSSNANVHLRLAVGIDTLPDRIFFVAFPDAPNLSMLAMPICRFTEAELTEILPSFLTLAQHGFIGNIDDHVDGVANLLDLFNIVLTSTGTPAGTLIEFEGTDELYSHYEDRTRAQQALGL